MNHPSLTLAAFLSAFGCSRTLPEPTPEDAGARFAQAMCSASLECGCGVYLSDDSCRAAVEASFASIVDESVSLDHDCFEEYLLSAVFTECGTIASPSPSCVAMSGAAKIGEPCVAWNLFGMLPSGRCAEGLACGLSGVCQVEGSPPNFAGEGEPCDPEFQGCGALYCVDQTRQCAQRTALGEPCSEADECEVGAYCEGLTGICSAQVASGQPCSADDVRPCGMGGWCSPSDEVCVTDPPFVCVNQPQA